MSVPALAGLLSSCKGSHSADNSAGPGKVATAPPGKKRKLIFIPQAAGDWELPMLVGNLEFCKLVGWEYQHIGNPIYSVQNHLEELNNAISAKPDAIVTQLESPGLTSGFRKALDSGIVMIAIDQVLPEEAAKLGLSAIAQDSLASGRLNGIQAATWAERITAKKEGVIIIGNGNPGSVSIDLRQKGTEEGIAAYNRDHGTRYTTEAFADSGFDDVVVSMAKYGAHLDEKGERLVGMVGLGGGSAVAIWKTLQDRNIQPGKRIAAGSHDIFPDQQTAIDEGYLQWGIDANFLAIGYLSALGAWMLLERGEPCWNMYSPGELVLKKDIAGIRARNQIWMAKARELNLLRT